MRIIEVNQVGVFLGMKAAIPAMLRNRGGSIVNISSTNGLAGYAGTVAYTASKFAVRGMTKNAALEYGKAGIRVNSIHPGAMDTPMIRPEGTGMPAEAQANAFAMTPIPRVGQPVEVAYMALFLASDESSYSTGAEFLIDGGMLAGTVSPYARAEPV
jgi:3alpha(or 20beta)-hydroxysteroid dehydrogenase